MSRHYSPGNVPFRAAIVCIGLLASHGMAQSSGIAQTYCSSENTGNDYAAVYDRYQSMGSCSETCRSQYAFAVLQGSNCWCSNYIPADQSGLSQCSATCPGYPTDLCGNQARGLFGYIALDRRPSGTAGGSSQPQNTPKPQSSSPPTSSQDSQTSVAPPSSSVAPYSSSAPADPASSSPPPSSSSASRTQVVRTSVITRSGSVVTQTVTTTPIIIPGNDSPATSPMQRGMSGGAIAGIVIGVLVGLAALAFAAFLLWRRRRQSDDENIAGAGSSRPKRTTSVLSRTGLLARKDRPVSMAEHHPDNDPYNSNLRNSHLFLGAGASIEPSSPLGGSQDHLSSSSRRASKPMVYDQRLNPSALFANAEANGSRVSMQDQQDYSRPLGIANPDFRPSFDSR